MVTLPPVPRPHTTRFAFGVWFAAKLTFDVGGRAPPVGKAVNHPSAVHDAMVRLKTIALTATEGIPGTADAVMSRLWLLGGNSGWPLNGVPVPPLVSHTRNGVTGLK